jgi:cyclophilin family peptidyl-prolyl cis-trans isomerase
MKLLVLLLALSSLAFAQTPEASKKPVVVMETSMGTLEIELDPAKAPETVKNFLGYVNDKFYDGTIFHRVINNFMIQGGGFTPDMKEKSTKAPIKNEAANGLRNEVGTIAMARTGDPHSATSQFFINVNDNTFLNYTAPNPQGYGYAVFGKVTNGMHVVNRIKMVKTGNIGGYADVPMDAVVIKSVRLKEEPKAVETPKPAETPRPKTKKAPKKKS